MPDVRPDIREVYEMVTKQKAPEPGALARQQKRQVRAARNQKIGAFALAAAICAVAVALFVAIRPHDGRTPAGEPTADAESEAVRIAHRFLDAFGRFDADAAMASLADDDVIADLVTVEGASGTEALAMYLDMFEAMGYEQSVYSCDTVAGETQTDIYVTCPYGFHALHSDELGLGPYDGSTFSFTVRDGAIVRSDVGLNYEAEFSPQMWEPFATWVSETYPADAAVMYEDGSLSNYALTEESIRLWEKRSREYVEVALSEPISVAERFMEARGMDDLDEAISLIDEDGADVRPLGISAPSGLTTTGTYHMDLEKVSLALETERIFGVTYDSVVCGPIEHVVHPAVPEVNVECSFVLRSRLRDLDGRVYRESFAHLGVEDGRITFLSVPYLNASFPGNVPGESWPFIEWLQDEHPEAGGPMDDGTLFHTEGQDLIINLNPQAIDLLERSFEEYERAVAGS